MGIQSTLSKTDTFGTGTNCPSQIDVRLIKSQIKGVKKGRDQLQVSVLKKVSVLQRCPLRESRLYYEGWLLLGFPCFLTSPVGVSLIFRFVVLITKDLCSQINLTLNQLTTATSELFISCISSHLRRPLPLSRQPLGSLRSPFFFPI